MVSITFFFFFQAEDGIRDRDVTGVQTCALPIFNGAIPLYDLHFVKANGAVDHYKKRGAKRVLLRGEGCFASIHHPYDPAEIPPQFKHDTVFVGTPLDHRVTSLAYRMDEELILV